MDIKVGEYTVEYADNVMRVYNSDDNCIHYKLSSGYESWQEFDNNNNTIHEKDSYGIEEWWKYNSDGNTVYHRDSNGHESWYNDGYKISEQMYNKIHNISNNTAKEPWVSIDKKYDSNGNVIYNLTFNGDEFWTEFEPGTNDMIHYKTSTGIERWYNDGYTISEQRYNKLHNISTDTAKESWLSIDSMNLPKPKEQITLRLDSDVLEYFKGAGPGYQTCISGVLREYVEANRVDKSTRSDV